MDPRGSKLYDNCNRNRNAYKGVFTRTLNDFNLIQDPGIRDIKNALKSLNRIKLEITTLEENIKLEINENESLTLTEDEHTALMYEFQTHHIKMDTSIKQIDDALEDLIDQTQNTPVKHNNNEMYEHKSKLPLITVPVFDGNNIEFQSFIEKFDSVVGSKDYIKKVEKLSYLQSYLKGPPLQLIEALPVTSSSYDIALDLLDKNYNNPEETINDLALKLKNLKAPKDNHESLHAFYCELECLLGQLRNNNINLNDCAWFIQAIIFNVLPTSAKQIFQRKLGCAYPNLDDILDEFPSVLRIMKTTNTKPNNSAQETNNTKPNNQKQNSRYNFSKPFNKEHTEPPKPGKTQATTLHSFNTVAGKSEIEKNCKFCSSKDHWGSDCDKYIDYASRVKRCEQLKICKICTGISHTADSCKSRIKNNCRICSKKQHVTAMCD